jgi:hypothetical protein
MDAPDTSLCQKIWLGRRWAWGLALAVVAGAVLRLIWVEDIEYKGDEIWTFERTQQVGETEPFPLVGMPTSATVRNPGMSIWIFLGLSNIFAVQDPTDLARACQLLNIAAILVLLVFVVRAVPAEQREPWLWAVAMVSLNPLAVLWHRKIWPPSIMPIFTAGLLIAWWYRHRRGGAFAWGLIGVLLGQFHPGGFFLAFGMFGWALLFDRRRICWPAWLAGGCLAALPLLPWLHYLLTTTDQHGTTVVKLGNALAGKFWTYWATQPLGIGLQYSLGEDFADFLSYPLVLGRATYLVALAHLLVIGIGVWMLLRAARWCWRERQRWRDLWIGRESETAFTLCAAFWSFGILFSLTGLPFHRHYLLIFFPLMFLWLARLALIRQDASVQGLRLGRTLLLVLCLAQFSLSASFLGYIHHNQGLVGGDYRAPYGSQLSQGTLPANP